MVLGQKYLVSRINCRGAGLEELQATTRNDKRQKIS